MRPVRVGPERRALLAAALAYASWGAFPLYFRALRGVPASELLAHRVLWSFLLLGLLLLLGLGREAIVRAPAHAPRLIATALLLSSNWLLYIHAVETGRVLEASLGYFITPLFNVALGLFVLGERLGRVQALALSLAGLGVLVPLLLSGHPPWIALGLAGSFGTYGLLRKGLPLPPIPALFAETALMAPPALLWLLHHPGTLQAIGQDPGRDALLVGTGLITTGPLLLFAVGARALPLSTMGMLQYLSPIGQLLVGLLVFHEPLGPGLSLTFGCTWLALLLLGGEAFRRARATRGAA